MKLSEWAKKQGFHYQTVWRWFKEGKLPIKAEQLPTGTIIVYENEPNDLIKDEFIPIYKPFKAKNQKKYVVDCLDTNWISSRGKYIEKFEEALKNYFGVKYALTTFNGSVSLMLILKALDIDYGDEVITSSFTYAATVSSINNVGATAVLIDCDENLQLDIEQVEKNITKKTKAVLVPELYSDAPNLDKLQKICKKHKIHLIEDSAEAFGCSIDNEKIGTYGIAASFSLFGNKCISTGEGGFVLTDNEELAKKLSLLKNQSHIGNYIHSGPGYNFRMTNIQAAIGLAQIEQVEKIIERKRYIAEYYRTNLDKKIKSIVPKIYSSEWLPIFIMPDNFDFKKLCDYAMLNNFDIRPGFCPVHLMNGFKTDNKDNTFENCEKMYKKLFNLPAYPDLTNKQLKYICEKINNFVK